MTISRRAFLSTSALTAAVVVAGCTRSTVNGITTVTLNVASVDAWGTALANGANMFAGLPGLSGTPTGIAILAVDAIVKTDLAAFDKAANGSVSLTFDSRSVPAAFQSLLKDGNTLLADVRGAVTGVASTDLTAAQTYLNAIETVVSLIQAAVGSFTVGATLRATPKMTETDALKVLGVVKK